jgi:hypothetical protein
VNAHKSKGAPVLVESTLQCGCKGTGDGDGGADAGAGPCASACADTACATPLKEPAQGSECDKCLSAALKVGGACNEFVGKACQAEPDCMSYNECGLACPEN